jgi:hypothetical protein
MERGFINFEAKTSKHVIPFPCLHVPLPFMFKPEGNKTVNRPSRRFDLDFLLVEFLPLPQPHMDNLTFSLGLDSR